MKSFFRSFFPGPSHAARHSRVTPGFKTILRGKLPMRSVLTGCFLASQILCQAAVTDAVVSKNGPQLNQGRVKGSVRVMSGDNLNLNSGLTIDGSLMVPGTPDIRVNGGASSPAVSNSSGSPQPSNYRITINGGVSMGGITRMVDPVVLPTAPAPVAGIGTRSVNINQPGDSPGNFSTIRSITVNAQGATINLPPGRYERVTLNGGSTLNLQAGTPSVPAKYEIQQLDVNSGCHITVPGPVLLRLKNSLNMNGYLGNPAHPEWLEMSLSGGSLTLNSQSAFHGKAVVPAGALTVNGNSLLHGQAFTDRLTLNGGGVIECEASGGTPNLPPVATASEISTSIGTPVSIPLQATDPENAPLAYQISTPPAHGSLSAAGPVVTYTPNAGFIGNDIFYFRVSDGSADSAVAGVVIHVFQPNRPPVVESPVFVINQGESNAPVVLEATDPDGDAVTYQIVGLPQFGTLSGTPPTMTYSHTGPRSTSVVTDSFTYKATDTHGAVSSVDTVNLQLQPVNRGPSAANFAATENEDGEILIALSGQDPDGDTLVYSIVADPANPQAVSGPSHGSLSGTAPQLTYRPAANFNGVDRFFYRVSDGTLASAVAEVVVTVLPVNDAPIAVSLEYSVLEDGSIYIPLEASDPDGDLLDYLIELPALFPGTIVRTGTTALFTPNADFNGDVSFSFTATDGAGAASTGLITLVVTPVNDVPAATAASYSVDEDTSLPISLTGTDAEGDSLSYEVTTPPQHGTLSGSLPDLIYTPSEGYHGPDGFAFAAKDAALSSPPAVVSIQIRPVNDPPVAQDFSITTAEDTAVDATLTASDPDDAILSFSIVSPPSKGVLTGTAPHFIYTPNPDSNGADAFVYTAADSSVSSAPVTVTIHVTPVNDLPTAIAAIYTLNEDSSVTISLAGSDPEGDPLTYAIEPFGDGQNGEETYVYGDFDAEHLPDVTFTPFSDSTNESRLKFTVSDGHGSSQPATIRFLITPVDDAPVVLDDQLDCEEDTPVLVSLGGFDPDNDPLTYSILTHPQHGTLSGEAPAYTYTPAPNYNGPDSFSYKINDGTSDSAVATISIIVAPRNDPPVGDTASYALRQRGSVAFTLTGSSVDGDGLRFQITKLPDHGTLSGEGANLVYRPTGSFTGTDSIEFIAVSAVSNLPSNPASINFTVTESSLPPLAPDLDVTLDGYAANILLPGEDPEGGLLVYTVGTEAAGYLAVYGTAPNLTISRYGPSAGLVSFTYSVTNHAGLAATGTVRVTIRRENQHPQIQSVDSPYIMEDTTAVFGVVATDPDGDSLSYAIDLPSGSPCVVEGSGPGFLLRFLPNFNGYFWFTVRVDDNRGGVATRVVDLTVDSQDDPPVVIVGPTTLMEDTPLQLAISASDPEGSAVTYTMGSGPLHGTLEGTLPDLRYIPRIGFRGGDNFVFTVSDGYLHTSVTVPLTVTPVNRPPVATQVVDKFAGLSGAVVLSATDPDGDALTYRLIAQPTLGTASIVGNLLIVTTTEPFFGTLSVDYVANDGTADSLPAPAVLVGGISPAARIVSPSADARLPVGQNVSVRIDANDPDGSIVRYDLLANGSLVATSSTADFDWTPSQNGGVALTVRVTDDDARSFTSAPLHLTVTGGNQAPAVFAGSDRSIFPLGLGENLIKNGSCDLPLDGNGNIPSWETVAGYQDVIRADVGSFSPPYIIYGNPLPAPAEGAHYFGPKNAEDTGYLQKTAQVRQIVPLTPEGAFVSEQYLFRAKFYLYVYSPGYYIGHYPDLVQPQVELTFLDAAGETLSSQLVKGEIPQNSSWFPVSLSLGRPSGAVSLKVTVIAYRDPGFSDYIFSLIDDVGLFPVVATASATLEATVSDDGLPTFGSLKQSWTQIAGPPASIVDPTSKNARVEFSGYGEHVFKLTASDGEAQASDTVTINVGSAVDENAPPRISLASEMTVTVGEIDHPLVATVTDDGKPSNVLRHRWEQLSGPSNASFADPKAASTTFNVAVPGTYVFRLNSEDGGIAVHQDIVVQANCELTRQPIDLYIITDHSGSMFGPEPLVITDYDPRTPIYQARKLVASLLDSLDPSLDRVSINKNDSASYNWAMPFTSDFALARQGIIKPEGEYLTGGYGSLVGRAISSAVLHVKNNGRENAKKIILHLNDGVGGPRDESSSPTLLEYYGVTAISISMANMKNDPINRVEISSYVSTPSHAFFVDSLSDPAVLDRFFRVALSPLCRNFNRAPQVFAGNATYLPSVASVFQPEATVNDDQEIETVSFTWEQLSGPAGAVFSSTNALRPSIRFGQAGSYTFKLTAMDGTSSSSDSVTVIVATADARPTPAGLIAYWPFDGSMRDLVGNRTLAPQFPNMPPVFVDDSQTGQALDLAGRTYPFYQVDGPQFDLKGSETGMAMSFWVKARPAQYAAIILQFSGYSGGLNGQANSAAPGLSVIYDPHIVGIRFNLAGRHLDTNWTIEPFAVDQWSHIVLNYNRVSKELATFTNGVLTAQTTYPAGEDPVFARNGQGLTIGYESEDRSLPSPGRMFDGIVDEVAVFNRSLNIEDIESLVNRSSGLTPPSLNPAPVVDAGQNRVASLAQPVLQLEGLATDDNPAMTVGWRLQSGPSGGVVFSNPELPNSLVTFSMAGRYTFELSANDGYQTVTDTVEVRVDQPCQSPLPANALVWLKADGDSRDSAGSNHLTWLNQPVYTDGIAGQAFQFTGSNGLLESKVLDLNGAAELTFEGWFRDDSNGEGQQRLFEISSEGKAHEPLALKAVSLGSGTSRYIFLDAYFRDAGGTLRNSYFFSNYAFNTSSYPLGEFYHLAISISRTAGVRMYVNGALATSQAVTGDLVLPNNPMLRIGGRNNQQVYPKLAVDELGIYKRSLDASEIFSIHQAGSFGKCPPWAQSPLNSGFVEAGESVVLPQPASHAFAGSYEPNDFAANPTLSWSLLQGPAPVTLTGGNTLTPSGSFSVPGRYVFELTVADGTKRGSDTVLVDVSRAANQAPSVEWTPPASLQMPSEQLVLAPTVTDDGLPTGILKSSWRLVSGPAPVTFDDLAMTANRHDVSARFTASGSYELEFLVSDDLLSTPRRATIQVLPAVIPVVNTAPSFSLGMDFTAVAPSVHLFPVVFDDGLPGHQLVATWDYDQGPAAPVFNIQAGAAGPKADIAFPLPGTYVIRLTVSDGELSGTDTLSITVPASLFGPGGGMVPGGPPVNVAPALTLIPAQVVSRPVTDLTLEPEITDPDGPDVGYVYAWEQVTGPAPLGLANPTARDTTISFAELGTYIVKFTITDGPAVRSTYYTIHHLAAPNTPPSLTLTPAGGTALPMSTVTLLATATDDADPAGLTYKWDWLEAPSTGKPVFSTPSLAETQVTFPAAGDYLLTCLVSDGQLSTRRTISYRVTGEPYFAIIAPQAGGTLSDQMVPEAHIRAYQDGGSVSSVTLTLDGHSLGQAHLEPDSVDYFLQLPAMLHGSHTLSSTATFADGTILTRTTTFQYSDSAEEALVVEIDSPDSNSEAITAPTPVIGTVKGPRFKDYKLEISSIDAPEVKKLIGSGSNEASSSSLGVIDPTLMENGVYTLVLSGTTTDGLFSSSSEIILIDGNMKLGQFSLAFEDMSLDLPGTPLGITRVYDSRDAKGGDFGPGWSLAMRSVKVRKTRPFDVDWEQSAQTPGFLVTGWTFAIQPTKRKRVMINFPGGRSEVFEVRIRTRSPLSESQPNVQRFAPIVYAAYDFAPVGGTQGRLEVAGENEITWESLGGNVLKVPVSGQFAAGSEEISNPTRFRYIEPGGASYVVDEALGLLSVSEPNGNTVTINRDGIHHSAGESLLFTRDAGGRITQITDGTGRQATYGYNPDGQLISFTDRANQLRGYFRYDLPAFPHYLTGIYDGDYSRVIRTDYDDGGRMVSQTDAAGKSVSFDHDVADRTETITDRLGHNTIHEFDEFGNVTRTTDALGGVTSRTYDANDNELATRSPLGFTTTRAFDPKNNLLSESDPLGHVSSYAYDAEQRPLAISDALNHTTAITYSSTGNLTKMIDSVGTATDFSYTGNGNIATLVDANGTVTSYTHDSKGREKTMKVTASNGTVLSSEAYDYDASANRINAIIWDGKRYLATSYEYDAENRLVSTRHPDGSNDIVAYDGNGRKLYESVRGQYSVYSYDTRGNLIETTLSESRVSRSGYDAEGRMTSTTDFAGSTTYTLYDALGRATATILPDESMPAAVLKEVADIAAAPELADNPRTITTYDADGRVIASTDALGNDTTFEYDAAGRRTAVIDALGQRTDYVYDAAGRQSSVTDAKGAITTFTYDAAGRLTRTDLPDGNFTLTGYDSLGRRIASTDAEGNVTQYAYDPQGRLLAVTDALGGITRYGYDLRGLQVSQTDALGRTTAYEYDAMGRRTARVLPEGQRETMTYDYNGNLETATDFNGHTIRREYDWQTKDLLAIVASPSHPSLSLSHAPARYEFAYDILGRRTGATVRNRNGEVLSDETFSYSVRSQLTGYAGSTGSIGYGYDAAGNLAGAKSSTVGGYDVSYDYDALNRLTDVYRGQEGTDPNATPLAGYNYDLNGNLNGVGYANGVQHAYTYNAQNRLTALSVSSISSSTIPNPQSLQGYSYTLNKNGHRTQISELSGRIVINTFDSLHRLTAESITQSGSGILSGVITNPTGSLSYSYDSVGNRTSRATSGTVSQIIPSQSQGFTANDRLTSDTYDANGNTTQSVPAVPAGSLAVTDVYSFDNKLIRRTTAGGKTIDLIYNTDGHRVSKLVSENGLTQRIATYLTDRNNPTGYAQVIEERDPFDTANPLRKTNLYGHDLISTESRSSGVSTASSTFYQYDGLGSVRSISDTSGELLETYDYDAYGTLIGLAKRNAASAQLETSSLTDPANKPSSEFLFAGEQWDEDLGMYFLRARYLNTNTGRFHTQDTYEGRNGEPLTLHKYQYANGSPVMMSDPSGRFSLGELSAVQSFVLNFGLNFSFSVGVSFLSGERDIAKIMFHGAIAGTLGGLLGPVASQVESIILSKMTSVVFGFGIRSMIIRITQGIISGGFIYAFNLIDQIVDIKFFDSKNPISQEKAVAAAFLGAAFVSFGGAYKDLPEDALSAGSELVIDSAFGILATGSGLLQDEFINLYNKLVGFEY